MTAQTKPSFHWNHAELDEICRVLPEFGAGLFVAEKNADLDSMWRQAEGNLIPNASEAGLVIDAFTWSTKEAETHREDVSTQLIDATFIRLLDRDEKKVATICQELSQWPCGLVLFASAIPSQWHRFFDFCVEFKGGIAKIHFPDGRAASELPCVLVSRPKSPQAAPLSPIGATPQVVSNSPSVATTHSTPRVSAPLSTPELAPAPAPVGDTNFRGKVALLSLEAPLTKLIETLLSADEYELATAQGELSGNGPVALVVASWNAVEMDRSILSLSEKAPVIVIANDQMRQEERIEAYRAGCTTILPRDADHAEIIASIISVLKPRKAKVDPFLQLDEEFAMRCLRLKRDVTWRDEDLAKAAQYYLPLIAIILKRSILSRSPAGALIIKIDLDRLTQAIPNKGLIKIFKKNVLGSLIGAVRQRDVTFLIGDRLVVISHAMSGLTERAIVLRIRQILSEMGEADVKVKNIHVPLPSVRDLSKSARELLEQIFQSKDF